MADEVKLRLYVTVIVIAMAILYVVPPVVNSQLISVRQELMNSCYMESPGLGLDFCQQQADKKAALPMWEYLLPFLPAAAILWFNWLLRPTLRLSDNSYPRRTMNALLWLGLLFAALGVWHPIWYVASREVADMYKIGAQQVLSVTWMAAAWLIAPLLFHHLVAPVSLSASMRKGKIALLLLVAAPVVAAVLYIVRAAIKDLAG